MEVLPSQGSQLVIPELSEPTPDSSDGANLSLPLFGSDSKTLALKRFCNSSKDETNKGCVNLYYPGGRKTGYYRYSYRLGKRKIHHHIRGGNAGSKLANTRKKMIEDLIAGGSSHQAIVNLINRFQRA